MPRPILALVAVLAAGTCIAATGCAGLDRKPSADAAEDFDVYPLYWVGSRFEDLDLEEILLRSRCLLLELRRSRVRLSTKRR